MTHPNSIDLEAFAVGEPLPAEHVSHVEECTACGAFLEQLRVVAAGGPSKKDADDAVARAVARAPAELRVSRVREREARRAQEPKRKLWLVTTSVIAPLAAAAAILVLARSPQPKDDPPTDTREPTVYKIQKGTMPPLVSTAPPTGVADPDTQFKGGMQVAVVRERQGEQARFSDAVRVKPGDRLRVEVALDHEQAILGGVLADDGSYLELMPQGVRGPGTHFSERSAKIDAAPTRGTILIGTPEAVAHARETKDLAGVRTLRVEWETP